MVIVKDLDKNTEHHVTVKTVDELPEKFRQPVRDALQDFEDSDNSPNLPFNLPDIHGPGREYRYKFRMPNVPQHQDNEQQQHLNEQMEELRRQQEHLMQELTRDLTERLERMEKDQQKMHKKLEKLQKKLSKKNSTEL